LVLSDVMSFPVNQASGLPFPQVSISPDGCFAFVNYTNTPASTPIAQLLQNVNGKLSVIGSLAPDPAWPNFDGGFANPCFSFFTLCEDNVPIGQGRVRVVAPTGETLASRVFTDLLPDVTLTIGAFGGGWWSPDGRFIVVSYAVPSTTVTSSNNVFRFLAVAPDLPVVASYFYSGRAGAPIFFELPDCSSDADRHRENDDEARKHREDKEKTKRGGRSACCPAAYHFAFGITPATQNASSVTGSFLVAPSCPNFLQVLKFVPEYGQVVLVDQVSLPAYPLGVAAWPATPFEVAQACCPVAKKDDNRCCDLSSSSSSSSSTSSSSAHPDAGKKPHTPFALVAVNTPVAIGASQVSPYVYSAQGLTASCTGNDTAGLRLYAFDGHRLTLVAAQTNYLRGETVTFSPDGEYLLSIERVVSLNVGTQFPGCPSEFAPILQTSKIPLSELREYFARKKEHHQHKTGGDVGRACVPCGATTSHLPLYDPLDCSRSKPLTCLRIVRIQGGFPSFPHQAGAVVFSANSRWVLAAGTNTPVPGDSFQIQLYRAVLASC
jgi:hypothetical protein